MRRPKYHKPPDWQTEKSGTPAVRPYRVFTLVRRPKSVGTARSASLRLTTLGQTFDLFPLHEALLRWFCRSRPSM